jgi:hypothetical protein
MSGHADCDALFQPLVDNGAAWCAPNIHADARWLDVDGVKWRVSVTRPAPRNCYVASATGQYLDYARDEIHRLPSASARIGSRAALWPLSPLLRALDPIVVLDALPVSTVLHPLRTAGEWERALDVARSAHGSLPIVVRSLDDVASVDLRAALSRIGLQMVPSRLVFHQDPRRDDFWRIRNVRNDVALASRTPMASRAITTDDCPRIAELYWLLYGYKHSTLNPQFQSEWLAHGMRSGAFRGDGIEYNGKLVAAFLSYCVGDVMTNPVFGYDTTLPQELGLYRRLSLLTMYAARRDGMRIHASSGAPGFKASRGGGATMEYHAVDLRSVRGVQRAAWSLHTGITAAVAPTLFKWAR